HTGQKFFFIIHAGEGHLFVHPFRMIPDIKFRAPTSICIGNPETSLMVNIQSHRIGDKFFGSPQTKFHILIYFGRNRRRNTIGFFSCLVRIYLTYFLFRIYIAGTAGSKQYYKERKKERSERGGK